VPDGGPGARGHGWWRLVAVVAVELGSETRYHWFCPLCGGASLPFASAQDAARERVFHLTCLWAR
jgi:hypothetical protein